MPTSDYEGFHVNREDETGAIEQLAGVDVVIYDVETETDLDTVTSDSNGYIEPGTVSVDAGSRIRFRVENHEGQSGSVTQITT